MYDLKDAVSPPDRYLGANVGKWNFSDGSNCWWTNVRDYTANMINLSKKLMEHKGKMFVYGKQAKRPMIIRYRPKLDISPVLNSKESHEYQKFIGITRWIIELGKV